MSTQPDTTDQQAPYQQAPYQQAPYQQAPYQQAPRRPGGGPSWFRIWGVVVAAAVAVAVKAASPAHARTAANSGRSLSSPISPKSRAAAARQYW